MAAIRYRDAKGRAKEVRYWAMTVLEGEFVENDEVDRIAWLKGSDAAERLSYARDRDVLAAYLS